MDQSFRPPTPVELAVFQKLLSKSFAGRDELLQQLENLTVRQIDRDGSLELKVDSSVSAPVQKRVATEARYLGAVSERDVPSFVNLLLHVMNGRMVELEVYKDDGSPILKPPHPDTLQVGWEAVPEVGEQVDLIRLISFIVVAIAAIVAFYPNYGFLHSMGMDAGFQQIPLMLILPIILIVVAGLTMGLRLAGFMLLMFVASVAFYTAMLFIFSIIKPEGWLHFSLLFVLPSLLILGAGYAMGILRNYHTIIRGVVFSIAAVALPPVAIYVYMFLWIGIFGL